MTEFNNYRLILDELDHTLSHVDDTSYERFANDVVGADRIFVAGKGRSGFVANSFAMRLNQLGEHAYVVGESTTPSIKRARPFHYYFWVRFNRTLKIVS